MAHTHNSGAAHSLAMDGRKKNLSISDGDAAHIVNVAPVAVTSARLLLVFNHGDMRHG